MYATLLKDAERATKAGKGFRFDSLLFVSKSYSTEAEGEGEAGEPAAKKAKGGAPAPPPSGKRSKKRQMFFTNDEEEVFYAKADAKFDTRIEVPDDDQEEGVE